MQVVTINHNCNKRVKELRNGFSPFCDFFAIDSGSNLHPEEKAYFDLLLPNVFYSGLINAAFEMFKDQPDDFVLYFVASDVEFSNYKKAIDRVNQAFADPKVGVYAPCANASSHKQMVTGNGKGFREVSFVEGFCFAVRLGLLREMYPVDLEVNQIGWGLDVMLGYLAIKNEQLSVVDYEVEVFHPLPSGYDSTKAKIQRDEWFSNLEEKANTFRKWATFPGVNTKLGLGILKSMVR